MCIRDSTRMGAAFTIWLQDNDQALLDWQNSCAWTANTIFNRSDILSTGKTYTFYYSGMLDSYRGKYKEIAKKKTKATQDKYKKIKVDGLKFLTTYKTSIYMTVASYMNIIAAKSLVIKQLNKVEGIGTYIKTDTGFKVTAPEGFVAIKSGSALKLVDRLEFSRANFTVEKNWG